MADNFNLPVVIYISKAGCPACVSFDPEWSKIKQQLQGKARLVKFVCDYERFPPPCLARYSSWFPSIICVGPKSYYRIYTPNDQINQRDYSSNYEFKAKKFNAVEQTNPATGQTVFEFSGRPNNAANFMTWFNRLDVASFDETTPPSLYANQFTNSGVNQAQAQPIQARSTQTIQPAVQPAVQSTTQPRGPINRGF